MSEKIFVGLSGGVDSATSASLLKRQGADVVGVFIKIWRPEFVECTWKEDRLDAMRVCAYLEIPFLEVDLSVEYKSRVIDVMLNEVASGRTPNPDVICNREIKFGAFLDWALSRGAAVVATGHYARTRRQDGICELLRGLDPIKDQSYFLYRLRQRELSRIRFPLGEMKKSEVRSLARKFRLPVADKPDSQGLCFVGDVAMPDFLRRFLPLSPGAVLDLQGRTIGEHQGALLYTRGERHGFRIDDPRAGQKSHYVVETDVQRNVIIVSQKRGDAAQTSILFADTSWIDEAPSTGHFVTVETRLRAKPLRATITEHEGSFAAKILDDSAIVAPGQSLVVYDHDQCLGGGIIQGAYGG